MAERLMKDSGNIYIGMVPAGWKITKFKRIKDEKDPYPIGDGDHGAIKPEDYKDNGIPYIRVQNLDWNSELKMEDIVYISPEVSKKSAKSELKPGDILIAKTGGTIGKTAIIPFNIPVANTTSSVGKVTVDKERNDNKYVYYLVKSDVMFNQMWDSARQKSAQPGFNIDELTEYYICIPSKEEQSRIANFLDKKVSEIDNAIEKTKKSIEEYKKLKQSIITEAVTKGLNPDVEMKDSGTGWFSQLPNDWECKKLKYACKTRNQKWTEDDGKLDYFALENIESWSSRFVETDNVYELEGTQICNKNDVVFGKLRPYLAKTFLVDYDRCCSTEFAVFYDFDGIAEYYLYLLTSYDFVNEVAMSTRGTKMPRANIEFIRNMVIPVPTKEIQGEIVNYLKPRCSKYDGLISKKEQIVSELEQYKKSLIYEYVTGKKEVA